MIEFLNKYSISEIIIFLVMFFLAIKEFINLIDWFKNRYNAQMDKDTRQKEDRNNIQDQLNDLIEENKKVKNTLNALENRIDKLTDSVNLLIFSDKDDIKAYITDRHHYFCYEQKWIDDYSLDCIEKRYGHYTAEGGNSFVLDLMNEIRALPKKPPK